MKKQTVKRSHLNKMTLTQIQKIANWYGIEKPSEYESILDQKAGLKRELDEAGAIIEDYDDQGHWKS
ncbi:MAG: hypothetical protein GY797_27930 [Deltaproteobacteria bacterium]|nr:hypothetical protein [Deltaproteobacteria bacterium]